MVPIVIFLLCEAYAHVSNLPRSNCCFYHVAAHCLLTQISSSSWAWQRLALMHCSLQRWIPECEWKRRRVIINWIETFVSWTHQSSQIKRCSQITIRQSFYEVPIIHREMAMSRYDSTHPSLLPIPQLLFHPGILGLSSSHPWSSTGWVLTFLKSDSTLCSSSCNQDGAIMYQNIELPLEQKVHIFE